MKKSKKAIKSVPYLKKDIIILSMLICIVIAMIAYWIYAYHHQHNSLDLDKEISHRISDYIEIDGNYVHLKNIDSKIEEEFLSRQENIENIINVDIKKGIYKDILSLMISYTIEGGLANYEETLTLNVDLTTKELVPNDRLIDMAGTNYKEIATSLFDEYIKLPTDSNRVVTDAITEEKLSARELNDNSEKYIIRIREKLPDVISLYIDEYKVYYIVRLSEIDRVCYYTNTDIRLANIKKEIGKI